MLYASLKMFLNIVWSKLEPKDLIITAVGTKASQAQVFSNLVEIIYELKLNRDSLCSLKSVVN